MRGNNGTLIGYSTGILAMMVLQACVPDIAQRHAHVQLPQSYTIAFDTTGINRDSVVPEVQQSVPADSTNMAMMSWHSFYADPYLERLLDSVVANNQELNIVLQEIEIAKNDVLRRQGEFLPDVELGAGAGAEKVGAYSRNGAVEESLTMRGGHTFPSPLPDYTVGATISWEVDVWKKLRNSTESARKRYLASSSGAQFVVTSIVAEAARDYYELMALDNILEAFNTMIDIQEKALRIVRQEKESARTTELAVRRFEAEVMMNKSRRYSILQRITETENRLNLLAGRYPQHIDRNSRDFLQQVFDSILVGKPDHLLSNRPDVRAAEMELQACSLDVEVARAQFFPTLRLNANAGYQSSNAQFLFTSPESMIYSILGDLVLPVINRNVLQANYYSANARQLQAVYQYERTVLRAYIESVNQQVKIRNMQRALDYKQQQVKALMQSADIAMNLFANARADYMEVLLTQRDALEAKVDLIETKIEQLRAKVDLYKALGGGWR